jgi:hypothetical protein
MRHSVPVMNDFDFLVGTWDSTNRKLRKRLVGSDGWEEFPGRVTCHRAFDGAANLDEIVFPTLGHAGMSVRLYDPGTDLWSIYWASSKFPGPLEAPVVGRFVDGVGEFFNDDVQEGQAVRVRYRWSDITDSTARWAQAFSADGGTTWETNWIMDFIRTEAA